MRFPNLFQTTILIFLLVIISWLIPRIIPLSEYNNLKDCIVSVIKVILLMVAILILLKRNKIDEKNITTKLPNKYLLLIGISIGILIVFNPFLASISFFSKDDILNIANSITTESVDIFVFLNLVIFTPIFEELLFRGLILSGIKNNYNIPTALILSSVLFGILHIDVIGAAVFGFWLGWIYIKTNNIVLCIIVHSACNTISFIFRIIIKDDYGKLFFTKIGENSISISILMLMSCITLFYLSYKKFKIKNSTLE